MVQQKGRLNLTEEERNLAAQWLLQNSIGNKVRHGGVVEAASKFGCHKNTIQSMWKTAQQQLRLGGPIQIKSKKKGKKRKIRKELDVAKMKSLSVLERISYRLIAEKMQVSKSLIAKWIKNKLLRPHTNAIRPTLTEANKFKILQWSLRQLEPIVVDNKLSFQKMYNVVHIDEKWFNITKESGRCYMIPGEEEPYRTCKSKRFIKKLMFIVAVSISQYSENGTCTFDGKIGIFPFITLEPAARNSKNRSKGTLLTKQFMSVNHQVIKNVVINKIVPAIKAKWSGTSSKHIIIQQDNAKPHLKANDPDFIEAANPDGFHIELVNRPSNSPDTNVNDLDFFRAIQTLKERKMAKGVDDLVKNVIEAFDEFEDFKLNNVFLTLQGCYGEIMKLMGGNNYKVPHKNKAKQIRDGTLPECLEVEVELVNACIAHPNNLANEGLHNSGELESAFSRLGMQG